MDLGPIWKPIAFRAQIQHQGPICLSKPGPRATGRVRVQWHGSLRAPCSQYGPCKVPRAADTNRAKRPVQRNPSRTRPVLIDSCAPRAEAPDLCSRVLQSARTVPLDPCAESRISTDRTDQARPVQFCTEATLAHGSLTRSVSRTRVQNSLISTVRAVPSRPVLAAAEV